MAPSTVAIFCTVANWSNEEKLSKDHLTRGSTMEIRRRLRKGNRLKVIFWLFLLLAACRCSSTRQQKPDPTHHPENERKHEFNFNCCAFRSPLKSEDSFYARCTRRAKHTPNIDTNFTSSYIFTARRFSPLRSEFVFLLLLLEFLFVHFCFAVHSSITY